MHAHVIVVARMEFKNRIPSFKVAHCPNK